MTSRPMSNIDKQGRQVQRYANFGVDMMEWADGGYVKYSDYVALLDELEASSVIPEELISAMEEVLRISDRDHDAWHRAKSAIAKCREVMS